MARQPVSSSILHRVTFEAPNKPSRFSKPKLRPLPPTEAAEYRAVRRAR